MRLILFTILSFVLVHGTALAQQAERHAAVKIVIDTEQDGESSSFEWTSDDMQFDLHDRAVGETRSFTDDAGRNVTVTRSEDGMSFAVDGKTIDMPMMGPHGRHMAFAGDGEVDVDVEVFGGPHAMHAAPMKGVTIISDTPLDSSVRESIKSVLQSAGHDAEITFIDGSGEGGKEVRVIKRKIEVMR